jgi:hypothetical protein
LIGAHLQRHDDLFQRGIACSLADAVDGAFNLAGAGFNCCQAVRHCQSQIVVAMHADGNVAVTNDSFPHRLDQFREFIRQRVTDSVRHVQDRSAGLNRGVEDVAKIIDVTAGGVFG